MVLMCQYCNKEFSSYQSRCNHIRIYHTTSNDFKNFKDFEKTSNIIPENNKFSCKYCNKTFTRKNNLNYHIKNVCKEKDNKDDAYKKENELLKKELSEMRQQLTLLINKEAKIHPKTLQKINKQLHNEGNIGAVGNNNTVNNNTFVKFGPVKLENLLTEKQILTILNKQWCSLEESIKLVHFNEKLPEYNNIFITNMRDNLAYIFDGSKFISVNKNDVISRLISNHTDEIGTIFDDNKTKLKTVISKRLEAFLDLLNNDEEYVDSLNKKHENYQAYKIEDIKRLIYDHSDRKKLLEFKKLPLNNKTNKDIEV